MSRRPPPQWVKVSARRQTSRRASDRRRTVHYEWPELRISNRWLEEAGFRPGDVVRVSTPQAYVLLIHLPLTGQEIFWRAVVEWFETAERAPRRSADAG